MNAKELRVGNLVNAFGEDRVYIVKGYSPVDIWEQSFHEDTICIESTEPDKYIGCSTSIDSINGIPLTEEWLKKFGFEYHELYTGNWYDKGDLCIRCDSINEVKIGINAGYGLKTSYHKVEVKYVHQLQNLYFALTGTELI